MGKEIFTEKNKILPERFFSMAKFFEVFVFNASISKFFDNKKTFFASKYKSLLD